jgi:GH24 family phage-related lysozyme (muramidase)
MDFTDFLKRVFNFGFEPADWYEHTVRDLMEDEGFREFAYPDPLSLLAKATRMYKSANWGFDYPNNILASLPEEVRGLSGKPWTWGYGDTHNVNINSKVREQEARKFLLEEMETAITDARHLCPSFDSLVGPRKSVLVNMAYNLGRERLSKFVTTLRAIDNDEYDLAAKQMKASLWYKQVGNRAKRLVEQMRTGEYQPRG